MLKVESGRNSHSEILKASALKFFLEKKDVFTNYVLLHSSVLDGTLLLPDFVDSSTQYLRVDDTSLSKPSWAVPREFALNVSDIIPCSGS